MFFEIEVITTSRLSLEPFSSRHSIDILVGWLNDKEVVRYSEQRHIKHTIESQTRYLESFTNSSNCFWAVIQKMSTDEMIGSITAYIDPHNSVADVGILIGSRGHWNLGFGTEAFKAVVDWLIVRKGMHKVTAGAMAENEGMIKIMNKIGMYEESRRRRYFLFQGREVDFVQWTIFAEEWPIFKKKA